MTRRAVHCWLSMAWVLMMLGTASVAEALSCTPRQDKYFLTCTSGVCQGAFRVTQVNAFGTCGRRAEVLNVDAADGRFLASLVNEASPNANGLFEVTFEQGFWGRDGRIAPGQLAQFLNEALGERRSALPGGVAAASPSAVVEQFKKSFGSRWLSQKSPDSSTEAVASERRQWEAKASREFWSSIFGYAAYWLGFLLILVALVWSIELFFRRLYSSPADQRLRRLLEPVAIQVIIGVTNTAAGFVTFGAWLGILFAPAVVVVLLAEVWASIRDRRPGKN